MDIIHVFGQTHSHVNKIPFKWVKIEFCLNGTEPYRGVFILLLPMIGHPLSHTHLQLNVTNPLWIYIHANVFLVMEQEWILSKDVIISSSLRKLWQTNQPTRIKICRRLFYSVFHYTGRMFIITPCKVVIPCILLQDQDVDRMMSEMIGGLPSAPLTGNQVPICFRCDGMDETTTLERMWGKRSDIGMHLMDDMRKKKHYVWYK